MSADPNALRPVPADTDIEVPAPALLRPVTPSTVPPPAIMPAAPSITNTVQNTIIIEQAKSGPGWFGTFMYFVFVGWWLSGLWIAVAWFFVSLVVTIPKWLAMINKVPKIATLREPTREFTASVDGTVTRIQQVGAKQLPFWGRALYFVFAGWYVSGFWLGVAWLASLSIIGLPLAIWMYNRVPAVTTLKRY